MSSFICVGGESDNQRARKEYIFPPLSKKGEFLRTTCVLIQRNRCGRTNEFQFLPLLDSLQAVKAKTNRLGEKMERES